MDNSSLYESDFSDEIDYTESESEIKSEHKRKRKSIPEKKQKKILVSTSDEIPIEDESVILLDGTKNSRLTLPFLQNQESEITNKGKIFTGDSITIISKKESLEHIISVSKGNYINGNSAVYRLKGGHSVVFHPVGTSWYADR